MHCASLFMSAASVLAVFTSLHLLPLAAQHSPAHPQSPMSAAVAAHAAEMSQSALSSAANPSPFRFPQHDEPPPSSSLEQLALRAAASPSAFLSLLSHLRLRLSSLSSLSAAEPSSSRGLSLEQRRVEEHFSKLKLSFLHLEAKQKFLAWMASDSDVPHVAQPDTEEAELAIAQGKRDIAGLKGRVEEAEEQVDGLIDELTAVWSDIEGGATVMRTEWGLQREGGDEGEGEGEEAEDWEELRQLMAEESEADLTQLCDPAHLSALLDQRRSALSSLTSSLASALSSSSTLQAEVTAVTCQAERLEADLAALTSRVERTAELSPTLHFLTQLSSTHAHLTGLRISRPDHNHRSLLLHLSPPPPRAGQAPVVIEVDCVPSSPLAFNGARLVSGDLDPALWDDIVDYAVDTQDLPFLVNEVLAHI